MQQTSQFEIVGGRFRAERLLKRGSEVETWLARDERTGHQAVVKAAPVDSVSLATRMRLEHEASVLGRLASPHVNTVLDVGEDRGWVYLAMPWVPGRTLADHLASHGALAVADALRVGISVATALDEVHRQGVLHRDVKPANVVVDGDGVDPAQRVVLIDFGLARSAQLHASLADQPVGTARYVSPEQAGLLDHDVDTRSDLYSLGTVLYECVSGVPLFDGATVSEVLRQQLTVQPPRTDTPRALSEVIQRLLRKDPRDRYHTAAAVLHDLVEIEAALRRGENEPAVVVGSRDERPTLTEPGFVGRRRDLMVLERHREAASRGDGRLVLLEGESGSGKSRLLEETALHRRRAGDLVLEGRGTDQSAARPFEVLAGVVADLVDACRQDPAMAGYVAEALRPHTRALLAAFPAMATVLDPGEHASAGPEEHAETRTVLALVALFDAVGTPDRPAMVVLDDCQWADDATLKVIEHWHRSRRDERWTGVAVAYRSEEVMAEHLLRRLPGARRLALSPLGATEVRQLAESMAGELPDHALQLVLDVSGGNPFMASAALRGLAESGTLWRDERGWHLDTERLEEVGASREAAVMLARRLDLLPGDVRTLLQVGAVLGKDFDPGLAAQLAGQPATTAVAATDEARNRHLVWMRAGGGRCAFVHDKVREALLDGLEPSLRRELHLRAAEWLERHDPSAVFDLAHHFDVAGLPQRGLTHALAAAERARDQHALELAERSYRMAERGTDPDDVVTRQRVAEGLGEVLMLRGHYVDAGEQLERAAALAADRDSQARVTGRLGALAFKRGDMRTSCTHAEQALRLLGRRVPRRRPTVLAFLLFEIVVQALHTLLPPLFVGRRRIDRATDDLRAVPIYSLLAYAYWFSRGRAACAWAHLREMNLAERYPPTAELAQAYSEHAPVMTMIPWHGRGIAYAERSLAIRRELRDLFGQGQSLHFYGVALYAASRYEECIERCREAVRLLASTGDRWEMNTARWHIAFCRYRLGDAHGAVEVAREVYQEARELGDDQATAIAAGVWAKATAGDVPDELLTSVLAARRDDVHATAEALQARALTALRTGQADEAEAVLAAAWKQVRSAGLRQEYVAPVLPWLATARRTVLEQTSLLEPRLRRRRMRHLRRTTRRANRLARHYRNNLPHALRERALADAMVGRTRAARRRLDRAVIVAESQGARRELGACLQARAAIGRANGWRDAESDREAAEAVLQLQPGGDDATPVTLSLLDRFETVVQAGRAIAGALTRDGVLESARHAATQLLRAERCELVPLRTAASDDPSLDSSSGSVSRSLVDAAVRRRRPVVARRHQPEHPADSLVLASSRSALAAPILVRGEPRFCLYMSHDGVTGLFGPEEESLAAYICTLAGAALENAEGFAEIEHRVGQRTAELALANRELDSSLAQLRDALSREQEVTERLRQLDEMKNEFVAMVAHDLRSPMTAVAGAADVLSTQGEHLDTATRDQLLAMISRSAKRLAAMVEDVLQVARLESGALRYELAPFDLGELVERLVEEHRTAGENRLRLRAERPLPPAFGDADRYWQVLSNLIGNACKFSPPDTPVEVAVRAAGSELVVEVHDRGPGIAADDIPLLFQKFSRLRPGDDHPEGTGLGLYICRSLVEAQGGRIWVSSELGQGSTFSFSVPVQQPAS